MTDNVSSRRPSSPEWQALDWYRYRGEWRRWLRRTTRKGLASEWRLENKSPLEMALERLTK